MIDNQYDSYQQLYNQLFDPSDIGINTQAYIDFYSAFMSFNLETEQVIFLKPLLLTSRYQIR